MPKEKAEKKKINKYSRNKLKQLARELEKRGQAASKYYYDIKARLKETQKENV